MLHTPMPPAATTEAMTGTLYLPSTLPQQSVPTQALEAPVPSSSRQQLVLRLAETLTKLPYSQSRSLIVDQAILAPVGVQS